MRSKTIGGSLNSEGERTLEVRWFLREPLQLRGIAWQRAPARTDWYAPPAHDGCNVKLREGRIETKIRVAEYGVQPFGTAIGRIEEWIKWGARFEQPAETFLQLGGFRPITKTRQIAHFQLGDAGVISADETVASGCQFEYSHIQFDNSTWWTVGFEAFGDDLARTMRAVAEHVVAAQQLQLSGAHSFGYPHFIRSYAASGK